MRRAAIRIRKGLAVLFGTVVALVALFLLYLTTSLPRLDGRIAATGLLAPVEIARDANSVPHLLGRTRQDVYFALGFAHAQDRLWQMDFNRHLVEGRLSEIFGERTLAADGVFRTLGLYRHAKAGVPALDAETREALQAYADGVNAYLAGHRGAWPPEFTLLLHRPEAWKPADSVALVELMSVLLSGNALQEIRRAALAARLSPQQLREFEPTYPDDGPVIVGALTSLYRQFALVPTSLVPPPGGASNNWVVSGARSATGAPLLANDTHLPLSAPGLWYLAHLGFPDGNAVGATLPGVPGLILGRTDRVAWGFTTTGTDVQDLFIEQVDPRNPDRYRTPDGWARFETRREVIQIRGGRPVPLLVRGTRHGPVVPAELAGRAAAPGTVFALSWALLKVPDTTVEAAIHSVRARDWPDFFDAFHSFVAPMQNIVYADRDGHIAFLTPGLVPVRWADNPLRGRVPAPGWDPRYDWRGFVPYGALPRRFDPPSGALFSANNKVVGPTYPFFLTEDWDSPYRAARIAELLDQMPRHDLASFERMQRDVFSPLARDFLPLLLFARPQTPLGRAALERMLGWNGRMEADAPQPLIFTAWFRALNRLVYADELGPLFEREWFYRAQFLRRVLSDKDGEGRWCDDIRTRQRETCAEQIDRALDEAAAELARAYGPDPARWRWGTAHPAHDAHQPFDSVPVLRDLFDLSIETPGGAFTLNRGLTDLSSREPYANIHAAAFRGIYDLADPDRSLFMQATGESGNPLSRNYRNFLKPWAEGRYITIPTARDRVAQEARHRLVLVPAQ